MDKFNVTLFLTLSLTVAFATALPACTHGVTTPTPEVTLKSSDPATCDKITDPEDHEECYHDLANTQSNYLICDNIKNKTEKSACYTSVARKKKDTTICDKIPNIENREWCYHEIAEATLDIKICDKITSDSEKVDCQKCITDLQKKK